MLHGGLQPGVDTRKYDTRGDMFDSIFQTLQSLQNVKQTQMRSQ